MSSHNSNPQGATSASSKKPASENSQPASGSGTAEKNGTKPVSPNQIGKASEKVYKQAAAKQIEFKDGG